MQSELFTYIKKKSSKKRQLYWKGNAYKHQTTA